ncbi:MAG: flagellar protein FlaG [Gammaproteobacteria bacterium]|nr:flagellar protein FlaG [Gammaproteobacteria bacterium]
MMNEISQSMLGAMPAQPKRESGNTSRVTNIRSADATEVASSNSAGRIADSAQQKTSEVEQRHLEEMVDDLNGFAQSVQRQLQFSIDQDDGKMIVKVVDTETKSVIREIPSEEIREMQKKLREVNDMLFPKGENRSVLFQGKA